MRRRKLNTWVQVNLRIQEAQRRKLEAAAKQNQVSFNDEVRRRLAESFQIESLESFLYKIGMVAPARGEKPAESIVGSAIREALEAKSKTQTPQQEQKEEPPLALTGQERRRREQEEGAGS